MTLKRISRPRLRVLEGPVNLARFSGSPFPLVAVSENRKTFQLRYCLVYLLAIHFRYGSGDDLRTTGAKRPEKRGKKMKTCETTCYIYRDDRVTECNVSLATRAGYTAPTDTELDDLASCLAGKLHKSEQSLRRTANSEWYHLDITVGNQYTADCPESLQDQLDAIDAASVLYF